MESAEGAREILGVDLVSAPHLQTLIPTDLLGQHIVHGNYIINPQNQDYTNHGRLVETQYLTVPYPTQELISNTELIEEENKLAAAFVAVQLAQQQKQQQCIQEGVIVNARNDVVTSLSHLTIPTHSVIENLNSAHTLNNDIPVTYDAQDLMNNDFNSMTNVRLPPLRKFPQTKKPYPDLNDSHIIANIINQNGAQNINLQTLRPTFINGTLDLGNKLILHNNSVDLSVDAMGTPESTANHVHIVNNTNMLKPVKTGMHLAGNTIITNINGTIVKEELDFDSKQCDDEDVQVLSDQLNALQNSHYTISDSDCSDVPTKRTRSTTTSRSLPHKKRISKRLKTKTSNNANTKSTSSVHASGASTRKLNNSKTKDLFSCQICGNKYEKQMEFYKHLKMHYEPQQEENLKQQQEALEKFNAEDNYLELNNEELDSPLLRAHLTEPHTILPNLEDNSLPSDSLNQSISTQTNLVDTLPNLVITNMSGLRCKYCPLIFKRNAALEGHVRDVHLKDHMQDEFSEPEDLMEGIRSVVEASGGQCSEDEEEDFKINLMQAEKNQRDWYQADELMATEVDLQEIEAEQNKRQNDENQQTQVDADLCDNSCKFEIREIEDEEFVESAGTNRKQKRNNNQRKCSFVCGLCGDSFDSREQYNDHEADCQLLQCDSDSEIMDKKSVEKFMGPKLNCLQCDRQFNHRNSLMYHIQSHSEKRPYQCEVCGNSFFATSALKVHMRRHSGDKPYQCRICLRHFRQWSDLKYHMVSIHSDIRQYQCEFCGKDFARKYSLIVHRRIHTGEKNYKCDFCNKTFRASSYLQNHRRIHTGEKPYPCEICGKPFRVRGDMKRHMSTHTRERSGVQTSSKAVTKKENTKDDEAESSTGTDNQHDDTSMKMEAMDSPAKYVDGASTEASKNKQCSLEVQVQVSANTAENSLEHSTSDDVVNCDDALNRFSKVVDGTMDLSKDTVYLWPVYMT